MQNINENQPSAIKRMHN